MSAPTQALPQTEYDRIVDFCLDAVREANDFPGFTRVLRQRNNIPGAQNYSPNSVDEYITIYVGPTPPPVGTNVQVRWLRIKAGVSTDRIFHSNAGTSAVQSWVPASSVIKLFVPSIFPDSSAGAGAVFSTGADGLVPGPTVADAGKFLRSDGTWVAPTGKIYTWNVPGLVDGQSAFALPVVPDTDITRLTKMVVNGVAYYGPPWFSRAGAAVTWLNAFSIQATDEVFFEIPQ